MISTQMLKGTLEAVSLASSEKEKHMDMKFQRHLDSTASERLRKEPSNPILLRWRKWNDPCHLRQSDVGPKRKYYSLTKMGRRSFSLF